MDEPLLARVVQGDRVAIEACLDRYGNLVWSLARRFLGNRADAEDAVREIFIDLWSNASRYDSSKASETTFVSMIARRRLIDRPREKKREPGMEALETVGDRGEVASSTDVETRDQATRAARLIRTLEPEQQRVIKLAVYHGHTHQSIADALGIPLGTVKTHLRRGLLRVREAMGPARTDSEGGARR